MDDEQQLPTRERILAAGAAIIADEGVTAHLSVRAVAARAGVSTGSLRHHFPTQQQLRDELMRRIYEWLVPADSIEDTSIPPRERLLCSGLPRMRLLCSIPSWSRASHPLGQCP